LRVLRFLSNLHLDTFGYADLEIFPADPESLAASFRRELVHAARRRTADEVALSVKYALVTRAHEFTLVRLPANRAS
jgi:hypothetical protein